MGWKLRDTMAKRNCKQESQALKAMKQCGHAVQAAGAGIGAVVSIKVDNRTHSLRLRLCMTWKKIRWDRFAVSMVSSLMMEVGRTIGFPMTIMTLKQGRRTHAQLKRLFSQYTAWFWMVGTTWQINEEFHIQSRITRKRLDQWAKSRRGKDAHARRDVARTVDARRKVLGGTVDVSAMGTVAPKDFEGGVGVALGLRWVALG